MSNEQTTAIASQATVKLNKTLADLGKVVEDLKAAGSLHQDLEFKISDQLAQLARLEVEVAEKARRLDVDLELNFKENALKKASEVLVQQNKVAIDSTELSELRAKLHKLQTQFTADLEALTAQAKNAASTSAAAAIKSAEQEFKVREAENVATIKQLTNENDNLKTQVKDLQAMIAAERAARVEEAKARGNAVVNVQSGK